MVFELFFGNIFGQSMIEISKAKMGFFFQLALIASILLPSAVIAKEEDDPHFDMIFHSYHHDEIDVYWLRYNPDTDEIDEVSEGIIPPKATISVPAVEDRVYRLKNHETRFVVEHTAHERHPFFLLHPQSDNGGHIRVTCKLARPSEDAINIEVYPQWSPQGAARFLDLVESKFFDGVALTRVVPRFLTQFGISTKLGERLPNIPDDVPAEHTPPFEPGMMAFAGSGPNSRTSEMFFVMPDCPPHQLNAFGQNPWETPFARLADAASLEVVGSFYSYGDMPPYGEGVQPQRIYSEGYEYLRNEFPQLDYFEKCRVRDHHHESEEL